VHGETILAKRTVNRNPPESLPEKFPYDSSRRRLLQSSVPTRSIKDASGVSNKTEVGESTSVRSSLIHLKSDPRSTL
jgi:hypothetical protein